MDPQSQTPATNQTPEHKDPRAFTEAILRIAADQRTAGQQLTGSRIFNDSNILRDYSNIALLALGGAITYLTVAEHLIKTKWLFYTSVALLAIAVILSLLARKSLHRFLDKTLSAHEEHYAEVTTRATLVYLNPGDQANQTRLSDKMQNPFVPPPQGFWEKYGATMVNGIFLAGFLSLAISLIFSIST
ncbi:MAG: hypothetical protein AAB896_01175 [Patescibacteria group bacterium]|mgnify:CR=1 FL=1